MSKTQESNQTAEIKERQLNAIKMYTELMLDRAKDALDDALKIQREVEKEMTELRQKSLKAQQDLSKAREDYENATVSRDTVAEQIADVETLKRKEQ